MAIPRIDRDRREHDSISWVSTSTAPPLLFTPPSPKEGRCEVLGSQLRLCLATSPVLRLGAALFGQSASPAARVQTFHVRGYRQRFKWGAPHFSRRTRTRNRAPRFFYACRSAAARGRRDCGAIPERCTGSE